MGLTVEDLKPKSFTVTIKDVELQCKPLRLSHALVVAKIGNVFQDAAKATKQEIKSVEKDLDELIVELIPELMGTELDMTATTELIQQWMDNIAPSDNKELAEKGVKFNTDDPKEKKIG